MATENELVLYGTVGPSWWDEEYFTAASVRRALMGMAGDITVRINSGGGIATEGQAIYTALKDYPGKVTVVVDGVAASAASLIAMAGDEIVMRLGAWMLIHDPATPWTEGRGTEEDHLKLAEMLGTISGAYADIYAVRSGMSREEARAIMQAERTLDGAMCVTLGFATRVETGEAAMAEASFDYRIYANAPPRLREASERLGATLGKTAVMAMIAGTSRQKQKEPVMANTAQQPAGTGALAEPATPANPAAVIQAALPGTPAATIEAAVAVERGRARRITDATLRAGLAVEMATQMIDEGVSLDVALDRITAAVAARDPLAGRGTVGQPTARILRDERETQRTGMAEALVAQMSVAGRVGAAVQPTDMARPFMDMSLVAMAAEMMGHKGSLRTADERLGVVGAAMASHSTSDLPFILENVLNKRLAQFYPQQEPTYREIAAQEEFADFRPHPMVHLSDMPLLQLVPEGGEIKFGTISEKKETVALASYGIGLGLTRQMLINDDLGAIDRLLSRYAFNVAAFEDATAWAVILSASAAGPTLLETGRAMFNTTDGTLAASGTAIDVTSVNAGRAAMRKRKRLDGTDLDVRPEILVVGPDRELAAEQLVASVTAQQAGNVNPFSGRLRPVVSAKITGNRWYLFANPMILPNFVYGYLQGATGPRLRLDQPFGRQGIQFTVEHDFAFGGVDWRGGYNNPGA